MSKITNKSVKNFLKSVFNKLKLTDNEFANIRTILDKAQYDCCAFVTVYWADTPSTVPGLGSRAIPSAYQLIFRDSGGNIIGQTDVNGPNPQIVRLPEFVKTIGLTVELNLITPQSHGINGTFAVTDSENGIILADLDIDAGYFTDRPFASTYIISTDDGV